MELINARHIAELRNGDQSTRGLYSAIELLPATGRATCRACGKSIAKAELALRFSYDFKGYGSYTAVRCWMHQQCGSERSEG